MGDVRYTPRCQLGDYMDIIWYRSHLLREPETTIDPMSGCCFAASTMAGATLQLRRPCGGFAHGAAAESHLKALSCGNLCNPPQPTPPKK